MNKRLLPICLPATATIHETMAAINQAPARGAPSGLALVVGPEGRLEGIVTDGDLRRAFQRDTTNLTAADIMGPNPITVDPDARMSDVVDLLTANKIANLFVVEEGRPTAIVHIAELMQAGYVA